MPNSYQALQKCFDAIQEKCYLSLSEAVQIRRRIAEKQFQKQDLKTLEELFKNWQVSDIHGTSAPHSLLMKASVFFQSNKFYEGSFRSKGMIDFFEFANNNPDQLGMLSKHLASFINQMETSWYRIAQHYAKLVLQMAEEKGKNAQ